MFTESQVWNFKERSLFKVTLGPNCVSKIIYLRSNKGNVVAKLMPKPFNLRWFGLAKLEKFLERRTVAREKYNWGGIFLRL